MKHLQLVLRVLVSPLIFTIACCVLLFPLYWFIPIVGFFKAAGKLCGVYIETDWPGVLKMLVVLPKAPFLAVWYWLTEAKIIIIPSL